MHSPRLTHIRTIALVVVTLGALTACSNPLSTDELPKASAQDRAGRLLTVSEAKAALPAVASLPVGWAPAAKNLLRPKNTKGKLTPARCQPLDVGLYVGYLRAKAKSYTTYLKPGRAALGVGIGSHAEAPPSLGPVTAAVRNCKTFQAVGGNGVVTRAKVLPLHLPHLAPGAVVTRLVMQEGSTTVTWDVVRIRVGHNEILADLVTPAPGKPNTKPLVTAVRNTLLNLG